MKRLVCLCALFFAGHVMAQTTCSNATFKGTYLATSESGELAAAVHIYAIARIIMNGDGTGTAYLKYTETGGLLNGNQTEPVTYAVNSDCSFTATAAIGVLPVTIVGFISPDGSTGNIATQTAGTSINGNFKIVQ